MPEEIDILLDDAIAHQKAKNFKLAEYKYTQILDKDANHSDANHNFGILKSELGLKNDSIRLLRMAIKTNPNVLQYWVTLIDTLINCKRFSDARIFLDQAHSVGYRDEIFDRLKNNLIKSQEIEENYSNILDYLKIGQAIKLAKKKIKDNQVKEALWIYNAILKKFPKNKAATVGKKGLTENSSSKNSVFLEQSYNQMKSVVDLYNEGEMNGAIDQSMSLLLDFPNSAALYNIVGAAKYSLGKFNEAIEAFERALSIKPDFAEAYNNVGNALRDQEKLKEASEAYEKALIINPKLYDTYISLGIVFKNQGKLAKAIKAYNEALTIQPDNIAGYVNIGIALTKQGKLGEGIEAFKQALSIEPDNAKTHYNIGNALKDQGKIIEAIEAYQKAVSIDPNFLHAHRSLSKIKKYTSDDPHIAQLQKLLLDERINDDSKCILSFTLAKIYEDLENFQKAFDHLYRANNIRKKLLNYSFDQDKNLFKQLKNTQAALFENSLKSKKNFAGPMPIFILGMPRSGTTLVEQIVSSHSQVTGGGELAYISEYGSHLVIDPTAINKAAISEFRTKYLSKLANLQNKNPQITDKMPLNFRFIPLICASLPEAKIIHVQRNAVATCWSNYKQYFPAKGLGYCHDLSDVASYYHLYNDLMNLWQLSYGDRIYNLNYDKLTEEQEIETRKLLEYLDLNWENSCLFPELNTRSVRTASQQQVRQEVFRGSSQFWQKYEQNIAGAFDSLFYL